jgi:hypothetical protein
MTEFLIDHDSFSDYYDGMNSWELAVQMGLEAV